MKKALTIILISLCLATFGSEFKKGSFKIVAKKSTENIIIDGKLDEFTWQKSVLIENFWEHWPVDTVMAQKQTEVQITYDNKNLYVGATVYDDNSNKIIQSLKRDNMDAYWQSDGLALILDPSNKGLNGYFFAVNAAGSQIEGLISQNGEWYKMDENWNNSWESEVQHFDDYWTIEMAIPFKSISFNPENHVWGLNFLRNDMKNNNFSTWTRFSNAFQGIDLSHVGEFVINELPTSKKGNIIITPSIVGGAYQDIEENESIEFPTNLSLDSKINLGSSLRLDLTLNPDFSQVEVDEQITNLSRFNPYFPEKRSFFLENSDLFSNLGTEMVRPIFTRRIGIEEDENIPILLGARLSGNITENARIGIMNIQTAAKGDFMAQNYSIATIQQSVFNRSTIKAFVANRQAVDNTDLMRDDYNRIGGAELNFMSSDSKWLFGTKFHTSQVDENLAENNFYSINANYKGEAISAVAILNKVNKNYISDIGFIPRLDNYDAELDTTKRLGYTHLHTRIQYKFMTPSSEIINVIRPRFVMDNYFNDDGSLNESNYILANFISFKNRSWFFTQIVKNKTNLPFPITIINDSLIEAKTYHNNSFYMSYVFDSRKPVSGELETEISKFYGGMKYMYTGVIKYRVQPWGNFGLKYTQNNVQLGEVYGNKIYHLIGPKAEISFSKSIAWTTFIQYNTQAENFNINTRFQWRYKPMSDIYVVFSNNYNTLDGKTKNYGVTFKLSYWLNI
jgi:Domain of unknown function (DUF5916)/Carbohydrate family 9 binding domain-like